MKKLLCVLLMFALPPLPLLAAEDDDDTFANAGVFDGLYHCQLEFAAPARRQVELWGAINSRRSGDAVLQLSEWLPAAGGPASIGKTSAPPEPVVITGVGRIAVAAEDAGKAPGPQLRYRYAGQTLSGNSFQLTGQGQQTLVGELGLPLRGQEKGKSETKVVVRGQLRCEGVAP
jgi:hypothetical protein